jgi:hypothetical protein
MCWEYKTKATILCTAYMWKAKALLTGCSDRSIRILKFALSKSFRRNNAYQNDITCITSLAYEYFAQAQKTHLLRYGIFNITLVLKYSRVIKVQSVL